MVSDSEKEFWDKVEEFSNIQAQQKQNGLNDYNMTNTVRKASEEVGMHSNIIYSLLNPNGLHYRGDLFLKLFIEHVIKKEVVEDSRVEQEKINLDDFGEILEVNKETKTEKGKRIDFTIESKNYLIGIEMKINAKDSKNQIYDYWEDLREKAKKTDNYNVKVVMFYLTKNGKQAPCYSIKKDNKCVNNLYNISFEEHILNWINECQKKVRHINNLNRELGNYKNIVNKAINKHNFKKNVLTLDKFMLKENNSIFLNILFVTYKESKLIIPTRAEMMYRFFQSFSSFLKTENMNSVVKSEKDGFNKSSLVYTKEKCLKHFKNKNIRYKHECKDFGIFYKIDNEYMFCVILGAKNLHFGIMKYKGNEFIDIEDTEENKNKFKPLEARGGSGKLFSSMQKWFSISLDLSKNAKVFLFTILDDSMQNESLSLKIVLDSLSKLNSSLCK